MNIRDRFKSFYNSSIRNKLLVALPLATLFLLFPSVLSILALRKQLVEHIPQPEILQNLLLTQTVTLVLISVLAISALAILVSLIAYGISHPITELTAETEEMAQGKRQLKPLPHEGADEVGTLARSINHFIGTIDKMEEEKSQHAALAAIGRMSAELAHEVRNPLGSIDLFCQLFPEQWNQERYRTSFLKTVPYELERIKNLVNGLLEVARPINLQFRSVNVQKVLLKATEEFQNGKFPNFKLKLEMNEDEWNIVADEHALFRVFKNLLQNAVQAMDEKGELTVTLKKLEDENDPSGRVELIFKDTGPGMDEETLQHIFEPFFTKKKGGTGLGLAICHKIVEGHGGTIHAASQVGQGATFFVQLPVKPAAAV